MSSPYAILNNRPVDQLKVTELREELKRRKLKTNGLKEELVKRLDGALRLEMEEAQEEAELGNGSVPDSDPVDKIDKEESAQVQVETDAEPVGAKVDEVVKEKSALPPAENSAQPVEAKVEEVVEEELALPPAEVSAEPVEDKSSQADNDTAMVDNIQSTEVDDEGTEDQDRKEMGHSTLDATLDDTTDNAVPLENSEDSHTGVGQLESSDQAAGHDEKNKDSKPSAGDAALTVSALHETTDNSLPLENSEDSHTGVGQLESSDQAARYDEKSKDSKPSSGDAALTVSALDDTTDNAVPLENSDESHTGVGQLETSDQAARYDEKNEDSKPSSGDAALTVSALDDTTDNAVPLENSQDGHTGVGQLEPSDQAARYDEKNEDSKPSSGDAALTVSALVDTTDNAVPLENSDDGHTGVGQLESSDQAARYDEKNEDSKPSSGDAALTISDPSPTNQEPEVSPDLGFQVRSESISNDSVSINEKNELKDNLNANNVNLELEVVKPEMVQPSSIDVPTIGGDSQPFEDDKELVDNQASLGETGDVTCATDMELCKKIEGVDGGSPEKINLDRSSGDESMEEDVLESKQIGSKNNSEEGERKEDTTMDDVAELGKPIDALVGGFSPVKKDMMDSQEETKPVAAAEKRKAEDQEVVTINNEPKRQRRWNSDAVKAPELQTANVVTSTPKDAFQSALRRSFSRSDSSLSGDAPKERIVPPSEKPATTSLRIDRFLRPFTLKAVQELLGKSGTVADFWMDQIKTHCYVTYSSVEEATATRNALYNLQWPSNGGRLLVAEFVDPQEVKMRLEAPPQSPAPVTPSPTTPTAPPFLRQPQVPAPSRPNLRQQQLPPPPPLPPPPALSNPPPPRERLPPPPPPPKKPDPPIMTLDDLFKKTKTTPRIYYLPLSEEQVAAKLQAEQGK